MSRTSAQTFAFSTVVRKTPRGNFYWIAIPAEVSRDIGRRGPVPVVATIHDAEVRASIVPIGGGLHRLQLNARVRGEAAIKPGDRVDVVLRVDENPQVDVPPDLLRALRDSAAVEGFQRLAPGKRRHIVGWIEEAVGERTREKRIAQVVQGSLQLAEADYDRSQSER